jgi:hypothetical protein
MRRDLGISVLLLLLAVVLLFEVVSASAWSPVADWR